MKTILLCILDGWGCAAPAADNAIDLAHTPHWDALLARAPHSRLATSGLAVGLPEGQMGNSEVGHMNIGCGRVVMQDLPRIDAAIADGSIESSVALQGLIAYLQKTGGACHLMGLLSDGGVHAHQSHLFALAAILKKHNVRVHFHAFLDGRDTSPASAEGFVRAAIVADMPFATVSGRYYAMDRDKRWERVEKAFRAIVEGKGEKATDVLSAVQQSYALGVQDEFVLPTVLGEYAGVGEGDALLMGNFRSDRVREISEALLMPDFKGFDRQPVFQHAVALTHYSSALAPYYQVMFPPFQPANSLGEVVAAAGLAQLRIAETEKYPHVTFFFNGGLEQPFAAEDRILVPSPKVATYDLQPEMSAPEVTDRLVEAIASKRYGLIVANYANTDMVGHTGNTDAARRAVEAVDACLGRLVAAIEAAGGVMCITADHGNAEQMFDAATEQAHTAHTLNPVPFVVVGAGALRVKDGKLADIAPTLLTLMQQPIPKEMTGEVLIA
jgi:2,3-bisphosphoglycerate-independent phosphoglycerate mutase